MSQIALILWTPVFSVLSICLEEMHIIKVILEILFIIPYKKTEIPISKKKKKPKKIFLPI